MKKIYVADLFCGAGGTSTGIAQACDAIGLKAKIVAVNHWDRAVETHAANHPGAAHHCQSLADLDPKKAVPGGKLDLLVASPECTHHSIARGGAPMNDQSRSSAWCILRWATALQVKRILIENVPEFESWGPLGTNNRPLKNKKGETFRAYVTSLESLGYRVEWRILNAADYGAATSRRRLFIQAAKGKQFIRWPDRTNLKNPEPGLFESLPKWRGAREVIDWNLKGTSIFDRKRPLSENTLRRIEAGLVKFGGRNAEPFLVPYYGTGVADQVDEPLATVTARDRFGLVEPVQLDIRFRMLQPHELAAAMGFPTGYVISGNRGEQVKQIGNAVEVNQAKALAISILG